MVIFFIKHTGKIPVLDILYIQLCYKPIILNWRSLLCKYKINKSYGHSWKWTLKTIFYLQKLPHWQALNNLQLQLRYDLYWCLPAFLNCLLYLRNQNLRHRLRVRRCSLSKLSACADEPSLSSQNSSIDKV